MNVTCKCDVMIGVCLGQVYQIKDHGTMSGALDNRNTAN